MSRTRYKPINHTDCFAPYELNGMEIMSSRSPHQAGDRSNQQFCFFPPGSTSLCWFAPAIQIICGQQIPASPKTWGVCFMTHGVQHPVQQCTTMYNVPSWVPTHSAQAPLLASKQDCKRLLQRWDGIKNLNDIRVVSMGNAVMP